MINETNVTYIQWRSQVEIGRAGRWKFILVLQVSLSRSRIIKSEGPQMQIHIENKCRSIL